MQDLIFVHGMFQNGKSWDKWAEFFSQKGYNCIVPSWPLHEGEPSELRSDIPYGLGELTFDRVLNHIQAIASSYDNPILIGHSVGGLVAQVLLDRGVISAGIAIAPVAPNRMIDFDWSFMKNAATITNPLKGDEPVLMDADMFHEAFANTLSKDQAEIAFEMSATHDSRNVLRGCMTDSGKIDLDEPHGPLLIIGAEKDEIIPCSLTEKNAKAYKDDGSVTDFREFKNRSHYICGEPGWEEVAEYVLSWIEQRQGISPLQFEDSRPGNFRM